MSDNDTISNFIKLPSTSLESTKGKINISEDANGLNKILVFYPADGSPVCTNQLAIYNEALPIFERYNAKIYGISTDDKTSHENFAKKLNLKFPLISDVDEENKISDQFGVYVPEQDKTKRAIFVFDQDDNLVWSEIYPDHINPGAEGILQALDEIREKSD